MAELGSTPSQTVGPFHHIGLTWPDGAFVVPQGTPGAVWLRGVVFDGAGEPIVDALVETWQADPAGRFDGFRGFGRSATRDGGEYAIHTVRPGRVDQHQAPHLDVSVFARGMLARVVTRVYFPDYAEANAADPVLAAVPADRRDTLLAGRDADGYRFDIRIQGERETVFFDV